MNSLNPMTTGVAAALTFSVVFAMCALAVTLFPGGTIDFFNAWFHGLDLTRIKSDRPVGLGQFLYGLLSVAIVSFGTGALFAVSFNLVRRS